MMKIFFITILITNIISITLSAINLRRIKKYKESEE